MKRCTWQLFDLKLISVFGLMFQNNDDVNLRFQSFFLTHFLHTSSLAILTGDVKVKKIADVEKLARP